MDPLVNFQHIFDGYESSYYGYLWSQVYSADLFTIFKKAGLLNKDIGKKYRKEILEPGMSRDAMDSIVAFLGRKPSTEPFFK